MSFTLDCLCPPDEHGRHACPVCFVYETSGVDKDSCAVCLTILTGEQMQDRLTLWFEPRADANPAEFCKFIDMDELAYSKLPKFDVGRAGIALEKFLKGALTDKCLYGVGMSYSVKSFQDRWKRSADSAYWQNIWETGILDVVRLMSVMHEQNALSAAGQVSQGTLSSSWPTSLQQLVRDADECAPPRGGFTWRKAFAMAGVSTPNCFSKPAGIYRLWQLFEKWFELSRSGAVTGDTLRLPVGAAAETQEDQGFFIPELAPLPPGTGHRFNLRRR